MKSSLRPWHHSIVLVLVFFIHASMFLLFIMVEMENGPSEAMVLIADENPQERISDQEWVALNNSLPNTQLATLHQIAPPSQDEIESLHQELLEPAQEERLEEAQAQQEEQKIDEAIDLASQFLEITEPEQNKEIIKEAEKKEEPIQEEKVSIVPQKNDQKNPLSFAQLAQGFANQIAQVDMAVESNRQGPASMEMVVMVNYVQKILQNIGQSYSITNRTAPAEALAQDAHVMLALNKDGSIHSLNIIQSSGNKRVDTYLVELVKHASTSFPPIPSALKNHPLRLPVLQVRSLADFRHIHLWKIKA